MPWTKKNYPKAKKDLSDKASNKAIQIENAILKVGKLKVGKLKEGTLIATFISKVKEVIGDYSKKRINGVKIYTL